MRCCRHTHSQRVCTHTHTDVDESTAPTTLIAPDHMNRASKPIAISDQLKELPLLSVLSANEKGDQVYLSLIACVCVRLCVCVCVCVWSMLCCCVFSERLCSRIRSLARRMHYAQGPQKQRTRNENYSRKYNTVRYLRGPYNYQ